MILVMYESIMWWQRTTGRCPCDVDCATSNLGPLLPALATVSTTGTAVANIHARSDMKKGIDDDDVGGVDDDVVRAVEMVFPGDTVMAMLLRLYRMDWEAWLVDMSGEEDMDSSATEDRRDSIRDAAGPAVVVVGVDDGRETHHSFAANAVAADVSTTGRQTSWRPGTMTSGRLTDSTHHHPWPRVT